MYESSLKQKWDYQNCIDYAVKEEKKHIAKSLKDEKLPLETIAKTTGLSIDEIEAL